MERVLITGATGLLGRRLTTYMRGCGTEVLTQSRRAGEDIQTGFDDPTHLAKVIDENSIDIVINACGGTDVDRCDREIEYAYRSNIETAATIADALDIAKRETYLIHISSDQVYSGTGPHSEDNVNPCNVYGLSKLSGERLAKRRKGAILRTNFFGKSHASGRSSFSDWVVNALRRGSPITAYSDVVFNAVHVHTLCECVYRVAGHRLEGIYNIGCEDGMTKADFILELASLLGLSNEKIVLGSGRNNESRARRPSDMRMDVSRIRSEEIIQIPSMMSELRKTANEY